MRIGELENYKENMEELAAYRASGFTPEQVKEAKAMFLALQELYFKLLSTTTTNTIIFTEDEVAPLPLL